MSYPTILVKKRFADAKLPVRANPTDSGLDVLLKYYLCNNEEATEETIHHMQVRDTNGFIMYPGSRALVDTGLSATVGEGYEIQVRSRSGLSLKSGITVLNSPGTIDETYRGPIGIILINHTGVPYRVSVGDKIAQLVVCSVILTEVQIVDDLPSTQRGEGGFGSTGK